LGIALILRREESAAHERDAKRAEIIRADGAELRPRPSARLIWALPFDGDAAIKAPLLQGKVVDHSGGARAGKQSDSTQQFRMKGGRRLRVRVFRLRQRQAHSQNVLSLKAEIGFVQPDKALDQQPGADQQHQRAAISTTTSALRNQLVCMPPAPPPSFNVDCKSTLELCSAGMSPKKTPVKIESAAVKAATRQSRPTSFARGRKLAANTSSASTPHLASAKPRAPPVTANSRLSVSSCLTMRSLPAPSAVRTAISLRREVARASNRLATLAQAISKTKPTANSIASSAVRMF